jgi:hypothetical protein
MKISTEYNNCLICLDTIENNHFETKHCDCKIILHSDCFNLMEKTTGLLCPICRIKKLDYDSDNEQIIESRFQQIIRYGTIPPFLSYICVRLLRNQTIPNFIMFLFLCWLSTFIFIIPYVLLSYIKKLFK